MFKKCELITTTRLKCERPGFSNQGRVDVYLSINNIDFIKKDVIFIQNGIIKIYHSNILVNPTLTSVNSFIKDRTFSDTYFVGTGFLNSSEIYIRFYDHFINHLEKVKFINSTHLYTNFVSFQTFNVEYPRELKISVTFDHGITEKTSSLTTSILKPIDIQIHPKEFRKSETIQFNIKLIASANIAIEHPIRLFIDVLSNPTATSAIEFNCNQNYTFCSSKTIVGTAGTYQLVVSQLIDGNWVPLFVNAETIRVYGKFNFKF